MPIFWLLSNCTWMTTSVKMTFWCYSKTQTKKEEKKLHFAQLISLCIIIIHILCNCTHASNTFNIKTH